MSKVTWARILVVVLSVMLLLTIVAIIAISNDTAKVLQETSAYIDEIQDRIRDLAETFAEMDMP